MKFLMLLVIVNTFLFSGGDFFSVPKLTKYEKMDNNMLNGCKNGCGEPARLLPYHGEDIPIAPTFPCPFSNACDYGEK
jgi:hypothetical protein